MRGYKRNPSPCFLSAPPSPCPLRYALPLSSVFRLHGPPRAAWLTASPPPHAGPGAPPCPRDPSRAIGAAPSLPEHHHVAVVPVTHCLITAPPSWITPWSGVYLHEHLVADWSPVSHPLCEHSGRSASRHARLGSSVGRHHAVLGRAGPGCTQQ
jgi:hypothetical protein